MAELSHLPWPYALGHDVEQDSAAELRASAAVIACTERGQRYDDLQFGVTHPLFAGPPVDTRRFSAELRRSDPRLDPSVAEIHDLAAATRTVVLADAGGNA